MWHDLGPAEPRSLAVHARLGRLDPLPSILIAFPRVYSVAWLIVALGWPCGSFHSSIASAATSGDSSCSVSRGPSRPWRSWGPRSGGARIKQMRESARALPPPGSPNVLLIVLDTVAAGHLNLHGYHRATSTTLVELAERGVRFDSARAASSWTLPSHATMFTGRWLHELSVGWLTPLDHAPTLAESLGDRGYSTAGFVGNTFFCAADSGLSRGFTHYRDFIFPELTALKTAVLVSRALEGFQTVSALRRTGWSLPGCYPMLSASGRRWTPIARGRRWSIASSLTGSRGGPAAAAVFRFLELLRCSLSLSIVTGKASTVRGRAEKQNPALLIQHWWGSTRRRSHLKA